MNIREELAALAQPISDFQTHPRNVRQGDVGAISESLRVHGQYRPIVVHRSTGNIIAGNHTYLAAKSLGWTHIAATFYEGDEDGALRILLADNKANDLALYDDRALATLLTELANSEAKLDGSLFSGDDLDDLLFRLEGTVGTALTMASLDQKQDIYFANDTRTLMFPLSVNDYVTVTKQLNDLRNAAGDEHNSQTIKRIVAEAYARLGN